MVTPTQVTRMLTDALRALPPLPQIILERQRPRIETATAQPSAPQRLLRTSLAPETPNSAAIQAKPPSGHGETL